MNKQKIWLQGNFSNSPFAGLLCRIYKSKRSGSLQVKTGRMKKKIEFKNGDICACPDSIDENKFAKLLVEKKLISPNLNEKCKKNAKKNNYSYILALHEEEALPIEKLWKFISTFIQEDLYPLFDTAKAEYNFNSDHILETEKIFFSISTLDIISKGIRQMQNMDVIKTNIPPQETNLCLLSPEYYEQVPLNPPEIYILQLIELQEKLKVVLKKSWLGKSATKKIIFYLISLGLIAPVNKTSIKHAANKLSQAKLHKIQETFNRKCSYIYKYISKEIGPAAYNVLEKCIEETKSLLSPYSQDISFDNEGKFKLNSKQKSLHSHPEKDFHKLFLQDLNEILAAEILAVKKTLGNEHESALVENLKKIGE